MVSAWHHVVLLDPFTGVFLALLVIACCTRFITGREFQSIVSSRTSPKAPATAPYVVPYFGHYITFCYTDPLRWILKLRHHVPHDLFAAHIWGRDFCVVTDQNLIQRIFHDHATSLSFTSIRWYLLVNLFGASTWHQRAFTVADEDALTCLKSLEKGSKLSSLIYKLVSKIQEETPGLVSFSKSIVDENAWERFANPTITPGNGSLKGKPQAVEVDMFALIRNFVGHVTTSSLVGNNFLEVQPKFLEKLWNFERKWQYMLLGLPRWLPMPGVPKAYIARRGLHYMMTSFHKAMDDSTAGETLEPGWTDLDDSSAIFKDRSVVWRAHKTPADVKASADLSLLWAANSKPSCLVFWMLFHIFSTPGLVEDIRQQVSPYMEATQPPNTFKIPELPRLYTKDVEGLVGSCPLLKACFYECLRLYSKHLAIRKVTKALSVIGTTSNKSGQSTSQLYAMKPGMYLVAPLSLHSHESGSFNTPELFNPSRFLSMGQDGKQKCDGGMLRPWGLGEAACPGRYLAEKQVLISVAAVVSLWDIEPAGLKGWEIPNHAAYSVVAIPTADIRVSIQPRKLLSRQD